MDECTGCGVKITPSDSNAAGVCVNCQGYDYYHGGIQVSNKLFQGTFDTRDGEREYTQYVHVLAPTFEAAREYLKKDMAEFYQDCAEEDGGYWSANGETFSKLVWVEELTEMTVGVIGGGWGHVDLEVRSE